MGSFNDLIICQQTIGGKFTWKDDHIEKNDELSRLRSKAWELADAIKRIQDNTSRNNVRLLVNISPHIKQLRSAIVFGGLLVLVAIQFRNARVTSPCDNSEADEIASQADLDKFIDSASATKRSFIGPKSLFETEEWKSLREKRRSNISPDPSDRYFTAYFKMQRATASIDSQPTREAILRLKNALRGFEEIAE